jgi:hypothetical protein
MYIYIYLCKVYIQSTSTDVLCPFTDFVYLQRDLHAFYLTTTNAKKEKETPIEEKDPIQEISPYDTLNVLSRRYKCQMYDD